MTDQGDSQEKKLHVDADWKEQVRAEKDRLASGPTSEATAAGAADDSGADDASRPMPPASFEQLVQTLATQALLFLSPEHDPKTGRPLRNIDLAKHSIDLLTVLEEKTRGNLTDAEKGLLDTVLYQIRMAYVQAAN